MTTKIFLLSALFIGAISTTRAENMEINESTSVQSSKKEKKSEKEGNDHRQLNPYEIGKLKGQVYLFGFSQEFGDTIAYLTDVCKVDSIMLQKKTKFLPFRYEFSLQLKNYLENNKGLKKQTPCVFYAKSKEALIKKHSKMKKRFLNMEHIIVVPIEENEFKFIHPLDVE